ncbi:MAG: hypothetical protein IJ848_00400 [Alphaproteobacteria bacterium]|nr:hypothetical protein [Alphaproteobacteria bacterium]
MINKILVSLLIIASVNAEDNSNIMKSAIVANGIELSTIDLPKDGINQTCIELNKDITKSLINTNTDVQAGIASETQEATKKSGGIFSRLYNGLSNTASYAWNGLSNATSYALDGISKTASYAWNGIPKATSYALDGISKTASFVWNNDALRNTVVPIAISGSTAILLSGLVAGPVIGTIGGVLKPTLDYYLTDFVLKQKTQSNGEQQKYSNIFNTKLFSLDYDNLKKLATPIVSNVATSILLSSSISGPVISTIGGILKPVLNYNLTNLIFKNTK